MRIGVDVGGTKIEAAALDRAGRVVLRKRIATPAGDYAGTVAAIRDLVLGLEGELGLDNEPRRATIGIGIPGTLSPVTGLVRNANSTCLNGRPFDRDLMAALARPLRFANDANCFALSEAIDGAGRGGRAVFGVILGTGVGGGIVIDGKLLQGANAIAGEWGHSPLPWPRDDELPGPACWCGKRGCIETFLSGPALAGFYRAARGADGTGGGIADAATLAARAAAGEPAAGRVLGRAIDRLARGLATVINLLDPDIIVLGGGVGQIARLYEEVPRAWGAYVFADRIATRLVPPAWGDASGVRGAAWLWQPGESP